MRFLRTNTAVIITVGPFYDKTDGVTIETGLTITNERITLTADTDAGSAPTNILDNVTGATSGTANDLNYITGNDAGMMQLELAAADVNRLGRMFLSITDAANHVPVFHEFMVLPAQVYDSLVLGTDLLDANASQLGGTSQTGRDVGASVLLSSGTGAGQLDFTSGVVKANLVSILATALTETAGQISAAFKKFFDVATPTGTVDSIPDAVAGASGGLLIAGSNAATTVDITGSLSGSVGSVTGAVGSVTGNVGGNVTGSVGSVTAAVTIAAASVQAIWDALTAVLTTANSIGKLLVDNINATISSRATQTSVDDLPTNAELATALGTADDAVLAVLGTPAGASVSVDIAAVKAQTAAIETDTTEIGVAGAGLTNINLPNQTMDIVGSITGNLSGSVGSVTAPITLTNPQGFKKNTAFTNFTFPMFDADGALATGLTVTGERRIDGGAFAALANSISEVSGGFYSVDLATTDLNGDMITLLMTATGAQPAAIGIKTVQA
jgi:hypothetical protein